MTYYSYNDKDESLIIIDSSDVITLNPSSYNYSFIKNYVLSTPNFDINTIKKYLDKFGELENNSYEGISFFAKNSELFIVDNGKESKVPVLFKKAFLDLKDVLGFFDLSKMVDLYKRTDKFNDTSLFNDKDNAGVECIFGTEILMSFKLASEIMEEFSKGKDINSLKQFFSNIRVVDKYISCVEKYTKNGIPDKFRTGVVNTIGDIKKLTNFISCSGLFDTDDTP